MHWWCVVLKLMNGHDREIDRTRGRFIGREIFETLRPHKNVKEKRKITRSAAVNCNGIRKLAHNSQPCSQ